MKVKFIVNILIIVILSLFTYSIIYADSEPKLETAVNIDESKNITITLKAQNVKLFEAALLEYDSNIIEYEGIEAQNNWEIKQYDDKLNISIVSNNLNNSEEKDIAILRFKAVNIENIDETCISFTNVKIGKENNEIEDLDDLNIIVILNEEENLNDEEANEDTYIPDGTEDNEEETNQEFEGDNQEESQEDADDIEDNSEYSQDEDESKPSVEEENLNDESKKDNLANKLLPQTGVVLLIVPMVLAIFAAVMAIIWFKKYKSIK